MFQSHPVMLVSEVHAKASAYCIKNCYVLHNRCIIPLHVYICCEERKLIIMDELKSIGPHTFIVFVPLESSCGICYGIACDIVYTPTCVVI